MSTPGELTLLYDGYKPSKFLLEADPKTIALILYHGEKYVKCKTKPEIDQASLYDCYNPLMDGNRLIVDKLDDHFKNYKQYQNTVQKTLHTDLSSIQSNLNRILNAVEYPVDKKIDSDDIKNLLHTGYPNSSLKKDENGLHFHNEDISCLIRIKKSKHISVEDIETFKKNLDRDDINCGIYAALHNSIIPEHEFFDIEFIGDKPILYVVNLQAIPMAIKLCIDMLCHLVLTIKNNRQVLDDQINLLSQSINYSFKYISNMICTLKTFKSNLDMSIKSYEMMQNETNEELDRLKNLFEKHPQLVQEQCDADAKTLSDKLVAAMIQYHKEHGLFPKASDLSNMGFNQYSINRAGGITQIKRLAKLSTINTTKTPPKHTRKK